MLIQADISSDKINFLIKKYIELLNKNIKPEEILFIVQNSYKKKYIIDFCKKNNKIYAPINTFQGLVYKTVNENWDFVSSKIKIGDKKEKPNLCSMELSQYIMKRCIEEVGFRDYFSKINLLHQLFRRYYLIIQNDLNEKEVFERSENLGEAYGKDAQKVLKKYEEKTLQYKCFDYLRQMSIFKYIYQNTDCFKDIKYLLLDDGDEITQCELNFLKKLSSQLKEKYICYDPCGASRSGYLSAKKNIENDFKKIFKEEPVKIKKLSNIQFQAQKFYENMNGEKNNIEKFETQNFLTRLQMIKNLCEKIKNLLNKGIKKNEISIIAPEIDFSLESFLKKYLPDNSYEFLCGNTKLVQDKNVKNILTVLKLANPEWAINIEPYEINSLLKDFLNIPLKYCQNIFTEFKKSKNLIFFEFDNKNYERKYKNLLEIINSIRTLSLSNAVELLIQTYAKTNNTEFLLKQIKEFEYLFQKDIFNNKIQKNIVLQFENSMIAENSAEKEINTEKIIISTPQKFIDLSHKVKYQFWLDVSSSGWMVEDIGNIYNAWAFQSDFTDKNFDYERLLNLTKDKTGRILRKLALLTKDKIYGYSSCYDSLGYENLYGILEFLNTETVKYEHSKKFITPRSDQKPVLEYKEGKLGIAAVPGAGKTTVLLMLIIKLLNKNISPENIFVLTYMDSAAKHFKEKLMEFLPDLKVLPNISTIHGLCLKILKDNSNYVKLNLDPNFQICDELNRKSFILEALYKSNLKEEDFPKYEKALSTVKLSPDINWNSNDKSLYQFKKFYENYNKILYENSMIDYDDMIFYAVKLLEQNPEILNSYQNMCKYIIEDEAQDSSLMQQHLLELLSGKNNNLIRCGDPNQSITNTFTNADLKGFQNFIANNKNIKMNTSQRCAEPIFTFANELMLKYPDSFFKNIMQGTEFNPKNTEKVSLKEFENDFDEKDFILNSVKNILNNDKNSTIAILLRNNYQVENYIEYLQNNKIRVAEKTDNLKNNISFNVILTVLEMLEYPYNNKILADGLKKLCEMKIYNCEEKDFDKIKSLKTPFLLANPDEFESFELGKFWWDFDYIFSGSNQEMSFLACFIADFYFDNQTELENAYMLSQVINSLSQNIKNEQTIIEKMKSLKNMSILGFVHLLKDEKANDIQNVVQIMTIHKSKGDEFDYVFVPEMSSRLFTLDVNSTKISSESYFSECLKPKTIRKSIEQMKQEQLDETLHLIYVASTRAKKQLFLSFSKNLKRGSKNMTPCEIFNSF